MRLWITASVLAAAIVATACSVERSGDVHAGASDPDAVRVALHDDEFAPATLELPAGEKVTVAIRNARARTRTTSRSTDSICRRAR
jgi:hypothetical protein